MLRQGDKVVMHTCMEAEEYNGKLWTVRETEFTSMSGHQVVFLDDYSGYFSVKFLQYVDLDGEV